MTFYKITENMRKMRAVLSMNHALYDKDEAEKYNRQVDADKIREPFINLTGDDDYFLDSIFSHTTETHGYYLQGDFTARNMALFLYNSLKCTELRQSRYDDEVGFAYKEDSQNCALCINRFRHTATDGSKEEHYTYLITIVKNSTAKCLEDRIVSVFYKDDLFDMHEISKPNLEAKTLFHESEDGVIPNSTDKPAIKHEVAKLKEELLAEIKALEVQKLVESIFEDEQISADKFDDLKKRFINKQNIDNRPKRKIFLVEFLKIAGKNIENIAEHTKDINFFELNNFKEYLLSIIEGVLDEKLKIMLEKKYLYFLSLNNQDDNDLRSRISQAKSRLIGGNLIFDPQGRVLFHLTEDIVSFDIANYKILCAQYYKKIKEGLKCSQENKEKIISALHNLPNKNSIIFLQHEFDMHLLLALEVYKKSFPKIKIKDEEKFNHAVSLEVNKLVMQAFCEALSQPTAVNANGTLNIKVVNDFLARKRAEIAPRAHKILIDKLRAETKLPLLSSAINKEDAKNTAKITTATTKNFIHTDDYYQVTTRIEGSEISSHFREIGDTFAHRFIKLYRQSLYGEIEYPLSGNLISTASLPVKSWFESKDYIDDVVLKLKKIQNSYAFKGPFVYNLLTAMDAGFYDETVLGNYQTQSAKYTILGAHQYNADLLKQNNSDEAKPLCLAQAISVNLHGKPLGYSSYIYGINDEATLLSEMSLCYSVLGDSILKNYKDFLNPKPAITFWDKFLRLFKSNYFVKTAEGSLLKASIENYKLSWKKEFFCTSSLDTLALAKTSIKKIMAFDLHFSHDYAKLIQSISLFIEQEAIFGCKSGNERAPIIAEREQILNKPEIHADIKEALQNLAEATDKIDAKQCAKILKNCIDKHYDDENLYGAAAVIPLLDQGAGHKIAAQKHWYQLSSNNAEESTIDNLAQTGVKEMQAHNKMVDYMFAAMDEHVSVLEAMPVEKAKTRPNPRVQPFDESRSSHLLFESLSRHCLFESRELEPSLLDTIQEEDSDDDLHDIKI
jgi:hypothetical protein